jgi:hypothetical protein
MKARNTTIFVFASVLMTLLLISAGCTSIPGPAPRTPVPTVTTPPVEIITMKTMRVPTPIPAVTSVVITTTSPHQGITATLSPAKGTYESRTCAQQGGGIAVPGQRCPGTWLIAVDTFSCCSAALVDEGPRNASVTIGPFDLVVGMDDDPGTIVP